MGFLVDVISQLGSVGKDIMDTVHVAVSVQGKGSLGQLSILVRQDLLLMGQGVVDIRVEVLLLLDHSVEVLFVVNLAACWIDLGFEGRVLLEHLL